MRIGLAGVDGSHAEEFLRLFNTEARYDDMRVTALCGGTVGRTQELLAFAPGVVAVDALQSLIVEVDALIVADRDGALHKAHALPAIAAGKPVFINKPLARSVADAEAIVDAATRAQVPLLSASALRWQDETQRLKSLRDGDELVTAYGTWYPENEYGGTIHYGIHSVELLLELLGPQWSGLQLEEAGAAPRFSLAVGGVRAALAFEAADESDNSRFGVRIGARDYPIVLGDDYMAPVTDRIAAMLRTGVSGMSTEELLAPIRLMEAIDRLLAAA